MSELYPHAYIFYLQNFDIDSNWWLDFNDTKYRVKVVI